jgi:energy-coupling factor transporter ATP-binding protein EcfA2
VYAGETRALDGVDLSIARGERVAIVGQNGSGKSTLVRHFNGLLRPTEGRVFVDGADARTGGSLHLAAIVGLAFQDPDRQIFAGKVRTEVSFGPGTSAGAARTRTRRSGRRWSRPVSTRMPTRTRMTSATRAGKLLPCVDPRDGHARGDPR